MGIAITSRKRKLLLVSAASIFIVLCIFATSTRNSDFLNEVNFKQHSLLSNDAGLESNSVKIPGQSNSNSQNSNNANSNNNFKTNTNDINNINGANKNIKANSNSKADTKKLTNGNDLVQAKEGGIDETKVMEAESHNKNSDNIPLIAGNPADKKVHDKDQSIENIDKDKKSKSNNINNDSLTKENKNLGNVKGSNSDNGAYGNSAANGIKANKNLGLGEQKENKHNEIKQKKSSTPSKDTTNNLSKNLMDMQNKAEEDGPSKDVGTSFNAGHEYQKIISDSPVVIFSKSYCPFSKKLKQLLKTEYNITPEPIIVELDDHENGAELQKHIGEETGRFTVPNFIVGGTSRGGADDILALHDNDELIDLFHSWSSGSAKIMKLGDSYNKDSIVN